MLLDYFVISILILFPYNILGQDAGGAVLCLLGTLYIVIRRNMLCFPDKKIAAVFVIFLAGTLPSFFITENLAKSFEGFNLYLSIFIYYIVFLNMKIERQAAGRFIYNLILISALISITFQGIFQGVRIGANFSYENTYSLLLLIALFIGDTEYLKTSSDSKNTKLKREKVWFWKQLIIASGIIFTGSRVTFALLILYALLRIFLDIRKHRPVLSPLILSLAVAVYAVKYIWPFAPVIVLAAAALVECTVSRRKKNAHTADFKRLLYGFYMIIPLCAVLFFAIPSNFRARLMNISAGSGVLQERLVIFSDSIRHILKYPLGTGINSFEYHQYIDQTAFYDVRYIHNSLLQVAYDMGLISALAFVVLLGILFVMIFRDKNGYMYEKVFIFSAVFLHSLWDFDFSFPTIIILIVMLAAFTDQEVYRIKPAKPGLFTVVPLMVAFFSAYTILSIFTMFTGDSNASKGYFDKARTAYGINLAITFKNPDVYYVMAQCFYNEASVSENPDDAGKLIDSCRDSLLKAEKINGIDPRVTANLAFISSMKGDSKAAIKYFKKAIYLQKYNMQLYDAFYECLIGLFKETGDEFYLNEIGKLKKVFEENHKTVNPKAKFLNDQLLRREWMD